MAAIIAQMAAANRERKKRARTRDFMPPNKSNVTIQPFRPAAFDPKIHNKHTAQAIEKERRGALMNSVMEKFLHRENEELRRHQDRRWYHRLVRAIHRDKAKEGDDTIKELMQKSDRSQQEHLEVLYYLGGIVLKLEEEDRREARFVHIAKVSVALSCLMLFAFFLVYIFMMIWLANS